MTEYGGLFMAWILVLYLMPFIYVRVLGEVDMDLLGAVILMMPTAIVFPFAIYAFSGHTLPFGVHLTIPVLAGLLILWNFFVDSLDINDNFLSSIINTYAPATVAMLVLSLFIGMFEFSLNLILIFIAPVAAYCFFKQLGYIISCMFFTSYIIFDLYIALAVSALTAASIILYKFRFRRTDEFEDISDISIEETIRIGMPVISHSGFSKVKNYSEIPDEAIDPYTLKNIHDLIVQGKAIVKCNACGTYYDKEILKFYGNSCAVFGCSNSLL